MIAKIHKLFEARQHFIQLMKFPLPFFMEQQNKLLCSFCFDIDYLILIKKQKQNKKKLKVDG